MLQVIAQEDCSGVEDLTEELGVLLLKVAISDILGVLVTAEAAL